MFNALDAFLSTHPASLWGESAWAKAVLAVNHWAISPKFDASQPRILCTSVVSGYRKTLDPHGGPLYRRSDQNLWVCPHGGKQQGSNFRLKHEHTGFTLGESTKVETQFESEPEMSIRIIIFKCSGMQNPSGQGFRTWEQRHLALGRPHNVESICENKKRVVIAATRKRLAFQTQIDQVNDWETRSQGNKQIPRVLQKVDLFPKTHLHSTAVYLWLDVSFHRSCMYMYIQPEKQSGNLPNLSQGSLATHKSIALAGVEGLDFTSGEPQTQIPSPEILRNTRFSTSFR